MSARAGRRPLTLGRIIGRTKRAVIRAFDALGSDYGDGTLDHLWRWLTATYARRLALGCVAIALFVIDALTLLLLFWSPSHGG